MRTLKSVSEVVREVGGRKAMSELTGVSVKAVAVWRWQNSFPSKTYIVLREFLRQRDCEPDEALFSFMQAQEPVE